ncbi:class II aldolase/adducin family protein, partial [candidate division KSB1 bacterium]
MTERKARIEMIKVCKRLYDREFVTAQDGNVTIKLGENRFLATPSGFCKGDLTESDLVVCDKNGDKIAGKYRVSSEIRIHIEAYNQRPDINAVVHAHPAMATAFSLAGVSLAQCILPEVVLSLGSIPTTEYATPTTDEGPGVIKDLIKNHDAMILDRHGSLTVGRDIWDAYYKLEKIEHTAKVTLAAKKLGSIKMLSPEQIKTVVNVAEQFGVSKEALQCSNCGACGKPISDSDNLIKSITDVIVSEINKLDN